MFWLGMVPSAEAWQERRVMSGRVMFRHGFAGMVRLGASEYVSVGTGTVRQEWRVRVSFCAFGSCEVWQGMAGEVGRGEARSG